MTSKAFCPCLLVWLTVTACRDAKGMGPLLPTAIEHADAVVIGRLTEWSGGTFLEPEKREGALRIDRVLKGSLRPGKVALSFDDGWLDYSWSATLRRSWLVSLLTIGLIAAAVREAKLRRRYRWVPIALVALPICTLWAITLPALHYGYQCGDAPNSVSEMTDATAVWPLFQNTQARWGGLPYHLPSSTSESNWVDREVEFAQHVGMSPETIAILERLRTEAGRERPPQE